MDKDKIIYVPVEDILPNRFQPRLAFDEKELNELASSIAKYGIIQPIVLRNIGDKYEIIAGERRFKASQIAGLTKVPAIINNTDDNTSAEIALLENLQRKNLTPIEEAQSYKKLIDRGFTQEEIATKLGVSQSSVANKMRLLNLPKRVQDALLYGKISERHARSLLTLNNSDLQINLLERIVNERLTVRQTEEEISLLLNKTKYDNDIPSEIQKFLDNTSEARFMKHTEVKEDVVEEKPVVNNILDNSTIDNIHLNELLRNEEAKNEPVVEVVNKLPEVVNIVEEEPIKEEKVSIYETSMSDINPFQNTSTVVERLPINNIQTSLYDQMKGASDEFFVKEEFSHVEDKKEEFIHENPDSLLSSDGSANIPKVIGKVRTFISTLDELKGLISTSELDLDGKYQIIIEIEK